MHAIVRIKSVGSAETGVSVVWRFVAKKPDRDLENYYTPKGRPKLCDAMLDTSMFNVYQTIVQLHGQLKKAIA